MTETNDTMDEHSAWCTITVRLLDTGTDYDTANNLLRGLTDYCVQLKTAHDRDDDVRRDVIIFDTYAVRNSEGGLAYRLADENGDPYGEEQFVKYEDILEIGVY